MEDAGADVHVALAIRVELLEEALPVAVRGLVRTRLRRGDGALDRHADARDRRGQEIGVGIREEHEVEAAAAEVGECSRNLGERSPRREGVAEGALLLRSEGQVFFVRQDSQSLGEHLAVGHGRALLDPRLDLVVALEQPVGVGFRPQVGEARPDPPVPIDERPVAVERRPPRHLGHGYSNFLTTKQALWPPKPKLFDSATSTFVSRDSFGM
jgi:hypothetical protein